MYFSVHVRQTLSRLFSSPILIVLLVIVAPIPLNLRNPELSFSYPNFGSCSSSAYFFTVDTH
jgi:hypothetical protein